MAEHVGRPAGSTTNEHEAPLAEPYPFRIELKHELDSGEVYRFSAGHLLDHFMT